MVLFTILAITLVCLILFIIFVLGVGGAMFVILFADVIVCVLIIIWIMNRLTKRKK